MHFKVCSGHFRQLLFSFGGGGGGGGGGGQKKWSGGGLIQERLYGNRLGQTQRWSSLTSGCLLDVVV